MGKQHLNGHTANENKMRVQFTLRHSSRSHPEIEQYAREAILDFNKYFNGVTDCHIILDHQNHDIVTNKRAEITVHVHNHTFVSKQAAPTYQRAIDLCVEHLCRQLQKHKEKIRHL
jgi:putative sigma-54 modulation protein